tara:strand:+ start:78 stop:236 length:159 start_codon:yes stop_codon:yes gene_type:complete
MTAGCSGSLRGPAEEKVERGNVGQSRSGFQPLASALKRLEARFTYDECDEER